MIQYHDLIHDIFANGVNKDDRTGTGTRSVFGRQLEFDLQEGFPLVTTKRTWFNGILHELLWMLRGDTNIKYLVDNNVGIWTPWALEKWTELVYGKRRRDYSEERWEELMNEFSLRIMDEPGFATKHGDLGPIYGAQWRDWYGYDQLRDVMDVLRDNPDDRRMIVSAWNVDQVEEMALPPCHMFFQFWTRTVPFEERVNMALAAKLPPFKYSEDVGRNMKLAGYGNRALSCQVYIRSNDVFLGAPFNIAQYALLTHIIAKCLYMIPERLVYTVGDGHLYNNHLDLAKELMTREPLPLPTLEIKERRDNPWDYKFEDFELKDYKHHPAMRAPIAV